MRFLSAEEVGRLANAMDERYQALIYLLAYGGLRIGEAAALRVDNLDLLHGRAQVVQSLSEVDRRIYLGPTKTRSRRTVTLPDFLRSMLSQHIEAFRNSEDFVFSAPDGGALRPRNFRARAWAPGRC
jgi:integrase